MIRRLTKLMGLGDTARGGAVHVAVFGKHPGWADHMDEIGLATDELVELRQVLYMEGIGRNIDLGTWEKLPEDSRLERFDHEFVYKAESGNLVAGRLWSSSDGRGRTKYPMLACVQCPPSMRSWLMFTALAELARAQERFTSATTADEVRSRYKDLHGRIGAGPSEPNVAPDPSHAEALRTLHGAGIGESQEHFLRTLYAIERELGVEFGRMRSGSQIAKMPRAGGVRVPRGSGGLAEGLWRWDTVLAPMMPKRLSVLLMAPAGCDWVDVLAGSPGADAMASVRTSSNAFPIASEIPYTMDSAFRTRVEALVPREQHG
ncbi:MAG: hypothetical protein ACI89L_000995 [Phycisphaerales bacterium]|jgi:hypothetical protein